MRGVVHVAIPKQTLFSYGVARVPFGEHLFGEKEQFESKVK